MASEGLRAEEKETPLFGGAARYDLALHQVNTTHQKKNQVKEKRPEGTLGTHEGKEIKPPNIKPLRSVWLTEGRP